jgi:DNA-binding GntR family transcriptional regulator
MERVKVLKSNLSERAYETIREMILRLQLKPGERIPEERISEHIQGSRTPVREALRRLNEEGLVRSYPGRYSEVAVYDQNDIKQIGQLRLAQDILSCNLAILNGSNAEFNELRHLAQECEQHARSGNIYERIVYDSKFHIKIAEIGKNEMLVQNQINLYMKIHLIQISKYTSIEDSVYQIKNHEDIIEGLYERDFKKVKASLCEHLQSFYNMDPEFIEMFL